MIGQRKPAFGLLTNGGSVWFAFGTRRFSSALRHHLPHIYKELMDEKPRSLEDLERILLGRYVYGRSTETSHEGMIHKILV